MSATKKSLFGAAALFTAILVAGVAMRPSARSGDPREVRLVARDMAFYLDGQDRPNPTLRFRAGETVRLVFRNEDRGMDHDFTVPDWAVRTRLIEDAGEDVITFTVPDGRRAPAAYACTPHSKMMRGTVEVE